MPESIANILIAFYPREGSIESLGRATGGAISGTRRSRTSAPASMPSIMFWTKRVVALLAVAAATGMLGPKKTRARRTTHNRRPYLSPKRPSRKRLHRTTPSLRGCATRWTSRSPATSTRWSSVASIRVAVTFNRTHYFIDKGQERGLTYEALEAVRERSEHGVEDRQPQGARGDHADVARSAVSRPRRAARSTWSRRW